MTIETMPRLGLGTWELTGERCRRTVPQALEMGYRHVDTAQMYGNEADVGQAIAASPVDREDLWLTTKLGLDAIGDPDAVVSSTEQSLRDLRTDHVDMLLIHWPVELDRLEDTLEAMASLRDRGLTRHLGVSNFTAELVTRAARTVDLTTNQVEHHALLGQDKVKAATVEAGAVLTAYSPLARGALLQHPVVVNIAGARSAQPAQIALRWLLDQDDVAVIPKASGPDHLRSNLAALDMAPLSTNDRAALDDLPKDQRQVDPPFAPDWD